MRTARKYSSNGLYHVAIRGVNKQNIFFDNDDRKIYLSLLKKYGKKYKVHIQDYTLMENHVHLLLHDPKKNLSEFMQVTSSVYARYFNKKYDRVGHLFQNRFLSECIQDDNYYKTAFRYILQNPVKAGLSKTPNYKWSSYCLYKGNNKYIQNEVVAKYFGSVDNLYRFVNAYNDDECMDIELRASEKEEYRINKIKKLLNSTTTLIQPDLPIEEIKAKVRILKDNGLSIKVISRLTGLMSWIVFSA